MGNHVSKVGFVGLMAVASLLLMITGWASGNGAPRRWTEEPGYSRNQSNVVQRPVYPAPGTKPFYLGGYAGASY